jgi:regulator of PEP synthase PpsR (kinase-PPPase family)
LTLDAERLAEIRGRRTAEMGSSRGEYASLNEIYEELEYAEQIHRRLGCPVIEMTSLAIEETAHRIVRLVEQRLAEQAGPGAPAQLHRRGRSLR